MSPSDELSIRVPCPGGKRWLRRLGGTEIIGIVVVARHRCAGRAVANGRAPEELLKRSKYSWIGILRLRVGHCGEAGTNVR